MRLIIRTVRNKVVEWKVFRPVFRWSDFNLVIHTTKCKLKKISMSKKNKTF